MPNSSPLKNPLSTQKLKVTIKIVMYYKNHLHCGSKHAKQGLESI